MLSGAGFSSFRNRMSVVVVALTIAFLLFSAFSSESDAVASGDCGDGVSYVLNSDGTLEITGEGAMDDYDSYGEVPSPFAGLSVKKVVVGEGITHIGSNSFRERSVASVDAPHVKSIGNNAFRDCSKLVSLNVPEVISIGTGAFANCPVTEIQLPVATDIGKSAFSGCSSLVRAEIPESTTIGNFAFYQCGSLTSIDLPKVTEIGTGAFSECTVLGAVSMPSASSLGHWAFLDCPALTSAPTPSAVSIGYRAFENTSLVVADIPSTLESLGERAFYGLEFYSGDILLEQTAEDLRGFVYSGVDGKLFRIVKAAVGDSFLSDGLGYSITSMDPLEASVTGYEGSPKALTIPDAVIYEDMEFSVVSVGKQAFYACGSLVSVDLGSVSGVGVKSFANCTRLKTVDAGDSLKTVSAYAFYRCVRLAEVDLDDSVKSLRTIGSYSFFKCSSLSSIVIPSYLSTMGTRPFVQTFSDGEGNPLEATAEALKGSFYSNIDGVFVRQPGIEVGIEFLIGSLTYRTTASIPAEVEVAGYSGTIRALVLSETVELDGIAYAVTAVGDGAFNGCKTLRTADLASVEKIGKQSFYGCSRLSSITAEDVTSIGIKAFAYCTVLSSIEFGDGLSTISAYAFCKCRSLQTFDAADATRTIGSCAFYKCSALVEVHTGSSLKVIGSYSFAYCPSIESIDLPETLKKMKPTTFDGLVFLDSEGDVLAQTAAVLRGHSYSGTDGILVASS